MKRSKLHLILCLLFCYSNLSVFAFVKPEAPCFMVKSTEGKLEPALHLALVHTGADVTIAGVMADVKVTQIYKNSGIRPIEAIYVFPGSSQSAVYAMKMTIGNRTIQAKIQEKEQAKKSYETAKKSGKSASLLEQHRPNVFQMNVANILPGDEIIVEMSYNELLIPENGVYTFFYPVVMGERYDADNNHWMKNFYTNRKTQQQAVSTYTFDMNVYINAGMPISDINSTSHPIEVSFKNEASAKVTLQNAKGKEGNRNYTLQYQLAGDAIQSGMLLYEGEKENFFLAMIQPPKRINLADIPPREYVFIVDISGSMHGFPIQTSKALLRDLISNLRKQDRFNVLLFAGSSEILANESLSCTPDNIEKAIALIESHSGKGDTEVLPALKRAYALPTPDGFSRTFVIATDGLVTVERKAFELIRNNLNQANVFPFGIGTQMNEFMIRGMAHAGQGEAFLVTTQKEAKAQAARFRQMIASPILTNIQTDIQGFKAYDIEPLSLPDVFAERPLMIFGKYKGKPKGQFTLWGDTGTKTYKTLLNPADFQAATTNSPLKYLWARQKIRMLQDYNNLGRKDETLAKEITKLALNYSLLTDYTSFVAVDSEVRLSPGSRVDAEPSIINSMASNAGAVPEPDEWAMIFLLMGFILFLYLNQQK